MAYCQNCGVNIDENANFCPSCGASQKGSVSQTQQSNETAKTVATAAGTALGVSMLSGMLRGRRRRFHVSPYGGMCFGPLNRGPMRGHGPMGRGPRGGGRGHGRPGGM